MNYRINHFEIFWSYLTEAQVDLKVCPSGWKYLVSSCYYFSTYTTTWTKARSACQKFGGDLAVPINNKENYAIWKIVKRKGLGHPYIGLVRYRNNKFYTVQGAKLPYTNWRSGEPNNYGSGEGCGHMVHTNGKWNDIPCSSNYHYVCQHFPIKRK